MRQATALISDAEKQQIEKYFGYRLEELTPELLKQTHKKLRAKYHPDNFEQFEDETVREMATERFQLIERLAAKIETYLSQKAQGLSNDSVTTTDAPVKKRAQYAYDDLKIEILTHDKDLKYQLFGTQYRWLLYGDRYKIPNTDNAYIIIDEDHQGHRVGLRESIRMYLTFDVKDDVDVITEWLFHKIKGRATSLLIAKKLVPIDINEMKKYIRKKTLLSLETGDRKLEM